MRSEHMCFAKQHGTVSGTYLLIAA